MLFFLDTEFTGLGIDPKLISIGLISEDGTREFYAELPTLHGAELGISSHAGVIIKIHREWSGK